MPNEHLRLPKTAEEWRDYRKASGEALAEGELAERWLLEQPTTTGTRSLANYLYAAGKIGNRDPVAGSRFDSWRSAVERTVAESARVARDDIQTFDKIVVKEAVRPPIADPVLGEAFEQLSRLPAQLALSDLPRRRTRTDRGAWEIAADTLLQHGIDPAGSDFAGELEQARIRVQRNAGDLGLAFGGFLRSVEMAVATANNETLPSATWRASTLSALGDDLRTALLAWDSARRSDADLRESDVRPHAEACHAKLAAFATACGPTGEFAQSAAFAGVTGLAMTMALGERLAAQINARAATPSLQGLYDRIGEVPVRAYVRSNLDVYRDYTTNFQNLASAWRADTKLIGKQLDTYKKQIDNFKNYKESCVGKNIDGRIADRLATWDVLVGKPATLTSVPPPEALRKEVNGIVGDLTFLRRYIESTAMVTDSVSDPLVLGALAKIKERQLARIDAVTAQMQRRLAMALQVT